ncbi:hypothetical protein [Ornithinimicrobium kibberense]|uniref:hypothetical protein n=1 Tax=Ornithinimicrobium kibberense TaxID=282060 RepID=UPI0036209572
MAVPGQTDRVGQAERRLRVDHVAHGPPMGVDHRAQLVERVHVLSLGPGGRRPGA